MTALHHCSICGKPLTDPISIARNIGPECIMQVKRDALNQGNLFAHRAAYTYFLEGGVLALEDLGGHKSLTNDMEVVLREIEDTEGDLTGIKIMYRDSFGEWDGVLYQRDRPVQFFSIGTTNRNHAYKLLDKKWKAASLAQ